MDITQDPANIGKYANNPKVTQVMEKMASKFGASVPGGSFGAEGAAGAAGPFGFDGKQENQTSTTSDEKNEKSGAKFAPSQPDID